MTSQALEFLNQQAESEQPFLLVVSWNLPHPNLRDAPKEERARYPFGSLPSLPSGGRGMGPPPHSHFTCDDATTNCGPGSLV